jgi:hypothetical protein
MAGINDSRQTQNDGKNLATAPFDFKINGPPRENYFDFLRHFQNLGSCMFGAILFWLNSDP